MKSTMEILVTFDENYISPFKVMLKSLVITDNNVDINIHLIHENIKDEILLELKRFCNTQNVKFHNYKIDHDIFDDSKTTDRYPISMYFRLLAWHILPEDIDRILYLDPDIIVINSIKNLYNMDLKGNIFAAASHTDLLNINKNINNIRLNTDHAYFNSGVILMDLKTAREQLKIDELEYAIQKYDTSLIMPDQDIFNHLYGKYTLEIPDELWNYDHRKYNTYFLESKGKWDLEWVMDNTSIIHFNGRAKPWLKGNYNYFSSLYRQLMKYSL